MLTQPDQYMIDSALREAAKSPCRSKRGVVLFNMTTGAFRGSGHNGPPAMLPCPGREKCAGNCGKRSVHAEVRALRDAEVYGRHHDLSDIDRIHVELVDGGVKPCGGSSCWQCAREILDVGFVKGVWLYERMPQDDGSELKLWNRYSAERFYATTLRNCGMEP